ncbi:MAG: hypothetical protein ACJ79B_11715 [Gemmatimonadaceae bacterium]
MTGIRTLAFLAGVFGFCSGCRESPEARAAQLRQVQASRQQVFAQRLATAGVNRADTPLALWIMPPELREISGLALTQSGRVLAHDDEVGRIYEIDPKTGLILKRFTLDGVPHADFEAITIAGQDIYLLQSNGTLFKFKEGGDGSLVGYTRYDTKLGHECEFEAVAFEADSSRLVMPCKSVAKKGAKHDLVMYRVALPITPAPNISMRVIPMADVIGANPWKSFHTSDIAIDPTTGNYVLIASQEKALAVITPGGTLVRSESLPPGHDQAEGVAVTRDSILIVSDEAGKKPADIALYRWRP